MKSKKFMVDGLTLHGDLFYPKIIKERNPAILFIHGWTSEKKRSYQYAEALVKLGFIVMVFDMRGHGTSDGDIQKYTPKEFLKDCIAAYDYFSSLPGVDKGRISLVGSSFGGYLGLLLSSNRKIQNLAMRVPADYSDNTFDQPKWGNAGENPDVFKWRLIPKTYSEVSAYRALHKFKGNILIIESEKDTVVPHQSIQNYTNAVSDKRKLNHVVIKGAPHSMKDGKFKDKVTKILVNWFNNKF